MGKPNPSPTGTQTASIGANRVDTGGQPGTIMDPRWADPIIYVPTNRAMTLAYRWYGGDPRREAITDVHPTPSPQPYQQPYGYAAAPGPHNPTVFAPPLALGALVPTPETQTVPGRQDTTRYPLALRAPTADEAWGTGPRAEILPLGFIPGSY